MSPPRGIASSDPGAAVDAALARLQRLHPTEIDLSLARVERLLTALGEPQDQLARVVHVAGTNGKGSVVAFLRAMAEAAKLRVQVYTSPHLIRFNERIRLAGGLIDDATLLAALEEVERVNDGAPITYFEATTAAAFLAFSRDAADLTLLEVGLGGRLDATNVIGQPAVTIITPISMDHMDYLGDSLAGIASEKAGIMKPGVPCVIAPQEDEALAVLERRAGEIGAPLLLAGRDYAIERRHIGWLLNASGMKLSLPYPNLLGAHQVDNAAAAAMAMATLADERIGMPQVALGLRTASWPARLQKLNRHPLLGVMPKPSELWLDGGHNPSAGQALAAWLRDKKDGMRLGLVVGMKADKDWRGFLDPLLPYATFLRAVPVPGTACVPPEDLAAAGRAARLEDVAVAADHRSAVADVPGPSRVLVCGSLYLAGAVLAENG